MGSAMIFCMGMGGPLAEWVETACTDLLQRAGWPASLAVAGSLAEIGAIAVLAEDQVCVVGLRKPDRKLLDRLAHSPCRRILCLDDLVQATLHVMQRGEAELHGAVRDVAAACATLAACGRADGVLVIRAADAMDDLANVLARLARFLDIAPAEQDLAEILQSPQTRDLLMSTRPAAPADGFVAGPGLQPVFAALSEHDQIMLQETLSSYAALNDGAPGRILWPRDLFVVADSPTEPAMRLIDVTGAARCLVYGPYLPVPPGHWRARVVIGFSAETKGLRFMVDVTAGVVLAKATVIPSGEEVREVEIKFDRGDDGAPAEIRIFSEDAAFEGHIALGFVVFTPETGPVAEPPASLLHRASS